MRSIAVLGAALGASLMGSLRDASFQIVAPERERPVTQKRRHVTKQYRRPGVSRYMPHIGAKEQARAKRCRMVDTFPNGTPRSAPIMVQESKG